MIPPDPNAGGLSVDDGMDELLSEFLVESFENLDQLDQEIGRAHV